jgi:hypothetical protein
MRSTDAALHVLVMLPGPLTQADATFALLQGAAAGNVELERLTDCTENALRQRLTRGDVQVLHLISRGKYNAAANYGVLEFNASGGGARTVNARHVGDILAQQPGLQLLILQAREPGDTLSGLEAPLREAGVPAVLTTAAMPTQLPLFAARLYRALGSGHTLAQATQAAQDAFIADPVRRAAIHLAAARPDTMPSAPDSMKMTHETVTAAASAAAPVVLVDTDTAQREQRERHIQQTLAHKRAAGQFDVFLCHNSSDKPAVKSIAQALKARGLLPWLDQWELPPGQQWQPLLEKQIASIRSAAVFVGSAGVGPWQEQELYGFLREFVSRHAPVIPILLPDAPATPELPIFLKAMTYVDFRLSDPDPLARLEWGITGVRPAD